jgi:hypothetical protein
MSPKDFNTLLGEQQPTCLVAAADCRRELVAALVLRKMWQLPPDVVRIVQPTVAADFQPTFPVSKSFRWP